MSGSYSVTVGDRGRLVLPTALRKKMNLQQGTQLTLLETDAGLVLATTDQLGAMVRADLAGLDLVGELLAARRKAALREAQA